jgi:hypothetical protein
VPLVIIMFLLILLIRLDCILQFSSFHDKFHFQSNLCGWWICEWICIWIHAILQVNNKPQFFEVLLETKILFIWSTTYTHTILQIALSGLSGKH